MESERLDSSECSDPALRVASRRLDSPGGGEKRPFKQRALQYATLINIVAAGRGIFSGTRTRES